MYHCILSKQNGRKSQDHKSCCSCKMERGVLSGVSLERPVMFSLETGFIEHLGCNFVTTNKLQTRRDVLVFPGRNMFFRL